MLWLSGYTTAKQTSSLAQPRPPPGSPDTGLGSGCRRRNPQPPNRALFARATSHQPSLQSSRARIDRGENRARRRGVLAAAGPHRNLVRAGIEGPASAGDDTAVDPGHRALGIADLSPFAGLGDDLNRQAGSAVFPQDAVVETGPLTRPHLRGLQRNPARDLQPRRRRTAIGHGRAGPGDKDTQAQDQHHRTDPAREALDERSRLARHGLARHRPRPPRADARRRP